MSITYEEALSTLTSMFGSPWDEDSLDSILRHFQGHMENTVEAVLGHGDGVPQDLIDKLENSKLGPDQVEQDAQLAQQLAMEQERRTRGGSGVGGGSSTRGQEVGNMDTMSGASSGTATAAPQALTTTPSKQGIGTPTTLPDDFLRIPGYASSDDAALARMLQDKLFAEEVRNNPEFAHLAGARGGGGGGRGGSARSSFPGNNRGSQNQGQGQGQGQQQGPRVMEALSGMGENAKKRFSDLALKFKQMNNQNRSRRAAAAAAGSGSGGMGGSSGGFSERRSLLDLGDDGEEEQEVSFLQRHDSDYEMKAMPSNGGNKKSD